MRNVKYADVFLNKGGMPVKLEDSVSESDCTPGVLQSGRRQEAIGTSNRDTQIDNCKFILIFLMVFGHTLEQFRQEFSIASLLFSFIYLFHMEAFVFLSGYHSKNVEKCRETAFERFFVPYVLVNFLTYAWIALINGSKFSITGFQLFMPHSTLWFLFALFVWRLLLKDLARIRLILPLSILAGLGSGIFDSLGIYYSLTRIFSFLPFFLAGYFFQTKHLEQIRKVPRIVGCLLVVCVGAVCFLLFDVLDLPPGLLYLSRNYGYYDIGLAGHSALWAEMALRFLFYILAAGMIIALLILVPRRDGMMARLGRNTMTVYLLHFFVIRLFKKWMPEDLSEPECILACVFVSVVLTFVFSLPVFTRAYQRIMRGVTRGLLRHA